MTQLAYLGTQRHNVTVLNAVGQPHNEQLWEMKYSFGKWRYVANYTPRTLKRQRSGCWYPLRRRHGAVWKWWRKEKFHKSLSRLNKRQHNTTRTQLGDATTQTHIKTPRPRPKIRQPPLSTKKLNIMKYGTTTTTQTEDHTSHTIDTSSHAPTRQ